MAAKVKFGIRLPVVLEVDGGPWEDQAGPDTLVRLSQQAEKLGYEYVSAADHVAVPKEVLPRIGARWYEPFVTLAFIAATTTRIRLFTSIVVVPYRPPLPTAKAVSTLDHLSGGRLIFGAAAGYQEREFEALGVPFRQRGAITNEYLRAMKALWTQEVASFEGRFCRFRDVAIAPRSIQKPHPPIWIGGDSQAALRRAVEIGDGWVPTRVNGQELRQMLDSARSLPAFAAKAHAFPVTLPLWPLGGRATRGSLTVDTPPLTPRTASVDQVLAGIHGLTAAGATTLKVGFRTRSEQEFANNMQWFAEEVAPKA
ncbi:MAG: LLM class F420-dependent oxidoreductase [Chloroflexi bacterium]|nr:LLM class F420-dependent oxidoreductase [Chloroflexota bacterium]